MAGTWVNFVNYVINMKISVKYTGACTRCGGTNTTEQREMESEFFEKMTQEDPKNYWVEGEVRRVHEESSEHNCPRSC